MSAAPGWANAIRSFASAMRELGLTSAAAGQYDLPRSSCATRCGFAEEIHGPRHPDVAAFLDALGDFYVERRDYPAAKRCSREASTSRIASPRDVLDIGRKASRRRRSARASDPIPRLIAFQTSRGAAAARRARPRVRGGRGAQRAPRRNTCATGGGELDESAAAAVQRDVGEWHAILECRTSLTWRWAIGISNLGWQEHAASTARISKAVRASAERPAIALDDRHRHEGRRGHRCPGAAGRSSGGVAESRNGRTVRPAGASERRQPPRSAGRR
jgi:hypothetical protein